MTRAVKFAALGLMTLLPALVACSGQDAVELERGAAPTGTSRPRPPAASKPTAATKKQNAPQDAEVEYVHVVEVTDVDGAVIELRGPLVYYGFHRNTPRPVDASSGFRVDAGNGARDTLYWKEIRELTFDLRPSDRKNWYPAVIRLNEGVVKQRPVGLVAGNSGGAAQAVPVASGYLFGFTAVGEFEIALEDVRSLRVRRELPQASARPFGRDIIVVRDDRSVETVEAPVVEYQQIWVFRLDQERNGIRMHYHSLRGVDFLDWGAIDVIERKGDGTVQVTLVGNPPRDATFVGFETLRGEAQTDKASLRSSPILAILPILDQAGAAARLERAHAIARRGPPAAKIAPGDTTYPEHPRFRSDPYLLKLTDSAGVSVNVFRPFILGKGEFVLDWREVVRIAVSASSNEAELVTATISYRDGSVRNQAVNGMDLVGWTELGAFTIPWRDVRTIETELAPPQPWPAIDRAMSAYYALKTGVGRLIVVDRRGAVHDVTEPSVKLDATSWRNLAPVDFTKVLPMKYRGGAGMVKVSWTDIRSVEDVRTDEQGVTAEVSLLDERPARIDLLAVSDGLLSGRRRGVPFSIKFDEIRALRPATSDKK